MSKAFQNKLASSKSARDAIGAMVAFESGTSIVPVMRAFTNAFTPEEASDALNEVRARISAQRKARGITTPLPPVQGSRVSEVRSILRLREWSCKDAFFDTVEKIGLSLDTLVKVSKHIRANVDKKTGACPSRAVLLGVINAKKRAKNKEGARSINVETGVDTIMSTAKRLAAVMGRADGGAFISAIMKAAQSLKPMAKAFNAKAKAEREAKRAAKK